MAEVKWIKVTTDIFDNSKIKQIRKMPDGDSIVVVWLQILCLAGRVNSNGYIFLTEDIPYTDEMLAVEFDQSLQIIKMALSLFKKFGMIDVTDNLYHVSAWEKYQNVDGMEKLREQNRIRVARHREKQKMLECNVTCNVTGNADVMVGNAIDKDKEEELDKEKENTKTRHNWVEDILDGFVLDDRVKETIREFIKMRKLIKAPMTDRALKLMINKLREMDSTPEGQMEILNQSIENSWKGLYPLKSDKNISKLKGGWTNVNRDQENDFYAEIERMAQG